MRLGTLLPRSLTTELSVQSNMDSLEAVSCLIAKDTHDHVDTVRAHMMWNVTLSVN